MNLEECPYCGEHALEARERYYVCHRCGRSLHRLHVLPTPAFDPALLVVALVLLAVFAMCLGFLPW